MLKLYYATGTCALATYITLEEAGADYSAERLSFKDNQREQPGLSRDQPQGPRAGPGDRPRRPDRDAGDAGLHRAGPMPKAKLAPLDDPFDFARCSRSTPISARRCTSNHAHKMRGARWATHEELVRRHEGDGSEDDGRLLQPDRAEDVQGAVGDGRPVHRSAIPISTRSRIWLEGDGVDISATPKIADHFKRDAGSPRGAEGRWPRRRRDAFRP